MATRASSDDVKAIIDVDVDITDITPFIDAANSLVTELCLASGYDDARLKLIEIWLAAHFYAIRDPRLVSQNVGEAGGAFQGKTGMVLSGTTYGQQCMLLDTAGSLAKLNEHIVKGKQGEVSVGWLGVDLDETEV